MRAVSGNSRDGACFKLDKQTWRRKKQWYTEDDFSKSTHSKFCDIWQNFYFHGILNNENFKMEVEQTNYVTHLIIDDIRIPRRPWDERLHSMIARLKRGTFWQKHKQTLVSRG